MDGNILNVAVRLVSVTWCLRDNLDPEAQPVLLKLAQLELQISRYTRVNIFTGLPCVFCCQKSLRQQRSDPKMHFLVQWFCRSKCGPNCTVCSTTVIPWVVPLQSCLSTWPQRLGCFQTTNWKCFPVSWWLRCLPSSSSCSSSARTRSSDL